MLICCIQPDQWDDFSKLNFWKDKHFVTMFTLFLGKLYNKYFKFLEILAEK